jgi:type II secretory pathway pseudopilin PulG
VITLRQRLQRGQSDEGLTLIEVIVAMMIFLFASVAMLGTMMSVLNINRDSRARQVATNLAAQEIDLSRDINDIFRDDPLPRDWTGINGDTFTVTRESSWVLSDGSVAACGSGTGTLRYKLVQVEVKWNHMRGDSVRSETYINPNERLNDITKGTLIIAVTTDHGEPVDNAVVTATHTNGTVLSGSTDSSGCLFFLGVNPTVAPAQYTVKISSPPSTSYVDMDGVQQPTADATIVAGTSTNVPFTFDPSGTIRATYVSSSTIVPVNLATSVISNRPLQITATTSATNPRSFLESSAYTEGFSVLAGDVDACWANDPAQWAANPAATPLPRFDGELPDPVAADAGSIVDVTVPMGALTVNGFTSTNKYLVAVSKVNATGGQPGCDTQQILRFPATTTTQTFALPYGSWDIYRGTTNSFSPTGTLKVTTGMTASANGAISSGVVTFDPRGTS